MVRWDGICTTTEYTAVLQTVGFTRTQPTDKGWYSLRELNSRQGCVRTLYFHYTKRVLDGRLGLEPRF